MRLWHLVAVLVIGYAVGVFWPGPGQAVKSKIMGAVSA